MQREMAEWWAASMSCCELEVSGERQPVACSMQPRLTISVVTEVLTCCDPPTTAFLGVLKLLPPSATEGVRSSLSGLKLFVRDL